MSKATRATRVLDATGLKYRLHAYDYEAESSSKGLQAADALGLPAQRVFKSLMTWVDERPVCAVIPSDRRLQLKKLASACGGKSARMMEIPEAERRSGYKVGGISPLGQQRPLTVVIDQSALQADSIVFNAGQRGLLVELAPTEAIAAMQASACELCD